MDEASNKQHRIWMQIANTDFIIIAETLQEWMHRNTKSMSEVVFKNNNFTPPSIAYKIALGCLINHLKTLPPSRLIIHISLLLKFQPMPTSEESIKKRKKEHIIEKLTITIFAFLIPPPVESIIFYILVIRPLPYGER
jgi:hypothetical protein